MEYGGPQKRPYLMPFARKSSGACGNTHRYGNGITRASDRANCQITYHFVWPDGRDPDINSVDGALVSEIESVAVSYEGAFLDYSL